MIKRYLITICILLLAVTAFGKTDFMKDFESRYNAIDDDIVNYPGEKFVVDNFVYQKDLATFTFTGDIYFIRYVDGRPTTILFDGSGHADLTLHTLFDKQALLGITKDSVISEDFERCIIRFADDLDLKIREKYQGEKTSIKWKTFAQIREERADFYFKPTIYHEYDNKFEQVRSIYERNEDGYLWVAFNRYIYSYDPNRPAEVKIEYEYEHNVFSPVAITSLPKNSSPATTIAEYSNLDYPTTMINRRGDIEMGGMDGCRLENAAVEVDVVINKDSLRFISMFLHDNLKLDSIYYKDAPVDFHRRKDFEFTGVILPDYRPKGDTVTLKFFYHGLNYDRVFPYVENPSPSTHKLKFHVPKSYTYLIPGVYEVDQSDNKMKTYVSEPTYLTDVFQYQGMVTGIDTLVKPTPSGINLKIIKSQALDKKTDCYVPDEIFDSCVVDAFNFFTLLFNNPIGTFEIFIYPDSFNSMPGLVEVPQVACYNDYGYQYLGGYDNYTGKALSQQWFGNLMKPASSREKWLRPALNEFLSMMYLQQKSNENYYNTLYLKRDSLFLLNEKNHDRPLFTASSAYDTTIINNKGPWLLHMLRFVMFDYEKQSDAVFRRFLYDLYMRTNGKTFTTADFIKMAEDAYGSPLDWFFNSWLFSAKYPEYNVKYSFVEENGQHYVDLDVKTKVINSDYKMPVAIRVTDINGQIFLKQVMIEGESDTVRIGPFENKPDKIVFNELFSVLGKEKVDKK